MSEPIARAGSRRARIVVVAAFVLAAAVVAGILLFAGPATAKQFATLRPLEGLVEVDLGEGFAAARDGQSLREGDVVRTGSDGRAEIGYFDGSVTRLDAGSTFELTELAALEGDADNRRIAGELDPGRTFNRVVEITDSQSRFDVATPTATASVRGTVHVTEQAPDGTFTIWVLDGEVVVVLPDGTEVVVGEGEGLVVRPGGGVEGPFALGPSELEDAWVLFNLCEVELTIECPEDEEPQAPTQPDEPEPDEPGEPDEEDPAGAGGGLGAGTTGGGFASDGGVFDADPPQTAITKGPRGPHGSRSATFRFRSDENGSTFQCRLDGGAWRACSSPRTYSGLAEGEHVFRVRATDPAGNTDPTPARRRFVVDVTPPDTTITDDPGDTPPPGTVTFSFVSSEPGSRFECRLEEEEPVGRERSPAQATGVFEPCSSPKSYAVEDFTSYTFSVRAIDAAGNVDPTPDTHAFFVCSECGVGRER